ncbi:MAG: iron-sulfur cluster assembly accessory protein [Sphingobacteriales bacterium]|nr:iron-sulfur cluster assembly accessory protein [Sphingobacteriales bacterium]
MTNNISSDTQTLIGTECPVRLTEGAVKEIKFLMHDKEIPTHQGLRLGVKGGGCSGLSYVLGFDEKNELDEEYFIHNIRIFINRAHLLYISGMEVDFLHGLNNRGFIFNNPNATSSCGCGSSFSA